MTGSACPDSTRTGMAETATAAAIWLMNADRSIIGRQQLGIGSALPKNLGSETRIEVA
ncbi:hypothetical protein NKI31_12240 [Mesorhizobium sp. M0659]|uniref:hypothetical protein n=1 Tax=Mesorhizobium sp. M0659 TaxID=2956980 RepID=UPI0033369EE0